MNFQKMDAEINTDNNPGQALNKGREYVYIVDAQGIQNAFPKIKTMLKEEPDCYLSVLYFSNDLIAHALFRRELELLERRFQSRLTVILVDTNEMMMFNSERIEVIINCSIVENQQFVVAGEPAFVSLVVGQLLFLSINKNKIDIQIN
jgi:hypothetical protein